MNPKDVFKNDRDKSEKITRETFRVLYSVYWDSLSILLDVKDQLIKEVESHYDEEFNSASLMLLSKSIQHLESIFILVENGLYGDAIILLRSVLSEMGMLYYLHYNPDLIDLFNKEREDDYQKNKDFSKAFNESTIDDCLSKKGMRSIKSSFQKISKSSHASAWGTQLFGKMRKGDKYYLKYGPEFDLEKANFVLVTVFSAHYDYLNAILWHRNQNDLEIDTPFWESVKERLRNLRPRVHSLNALGKNIILNRKFFSE